MNEKNKHPEAITRAGDYVNPFQKEGRPDHLSHGAVAIESERAIAQIQAKVLMAKKFPRDPADCFERVAEACGSLSLAEVAFYSYPRGSEIVNGATIRLAEELAQIWGNIDVSVLELARREGETELAAVAWDMETNVSNSVNFTVKHELDTKGGARELKANRDIRDLTANVSARKVRGRILAVLPEALVKAAIDMCRDTLARSIASTLEDTRAALVGQFKQFGVSEGAILRKFDARNLNAINARQVATLGSIFRTIKAGEASAAEIFEQGLTSADIRNRKAQGGHQAPQGNQAPPKATTPAPSQEQATQGPPQGNQAPPPQAKPQETKKGTVAWYKMKIQDLGGVPAKGAKLAQLQAQYAELLEQDMREKRTGEEAHQEPHQGDSQEEATQAVNQAIEEAQGQEEPPQTAYQDDEDWFNE